MIETDPLVISSNSSEQRIRRVLLLNFLLLPALIIGYQFFVRPALFGPGVVDIHAAIAESGGFTPAYVQVQVGQTVRLRFSPSDMPHGITIGPGLGVNLSPVAPGRWNEMVLRFDAAGRYTYACTTWCSPNHWRMRGTIDVVDPANPQPVAERDAVIDALTAEGVDIDAALHEPQMPRVELATQPSAARGAALAAALTLPPDLRDETARQRLTPMQALDLLAAVNPGAAAADLTDVVAYLWTDTRADLTGAAMIYATNCAYCHGPSGGGDGFQAAILAVKPTAFADAGVMFLRRGDVLYAKIRRGGMGTDMPNFGVLFTPDETWALVRYLWSLTFARSGA